MNPPVRGYEPVRMIAIVITNVLTEYCSLIQVQPHADDNFATTVGRGGGDKHTSMNTCTSASTRAGADLCARTRLAPCRRSMLPFENPMRSFLNVATSLRVPPLVALQSSSLLQEPWELS